MIQATHHCLYSDRFLTDAEVTDFVLHTISTIKATPPPHRRVCRQKAAGRDKELTLTRPSELKLTLRKRTSL